MKKILSVLTLSVVLAAPAFAADSKTTTHSADGATTEHTADTTHNPLTGNDTTTHETETKDANGKVVGKTKHKMKRDHKTGAMEKKSMDSKKETSDGSKKEETHSETTTH